MEALAGYNLDLLINESCHVFSQFSVWFAENLLALNSKKTNFVLFSLYKCMVPKVINFYVHSVNNVKFVKYLDFVLDCNLNWHENVINVNNKISKGLDMLKVCRALLPHSCLLNIYYVYVYPYLMYGIEFWGVAGKTILRVTEVLQNKCIRVLCNANMFSYAATLAKKCSILLSTDIYQYYTLNLLFKVHLQLCCPIITEIFIKFDKVHKYNSRSLQYNFIIKPCRTNIRKLFIINSGAMLWNKSPMEFHKCTTYLCFKRMLKKYASLTLSIIFILLCIM